MEMKNTCDSFSRNFEWKASFGDRAVDRRMVLNIVAKETC
jgi:hypothetical protein